MDRCLETGSWARVGLIFTRNPAACSQRSCLLAHFQTEVRKGKPHKSGRHKSSVVAQTQIREMAVLHCNRDVTFASWPTKCSL